MKILQSLPEILLTDQASFMESDNGLPWAALCNKQQIIFNFLGIHYHNINPSGIKERVICKPIVFLLSFSIILEWHFKPF